MSQRFVMATGNAGKLREIRQILDGSGVLIVPQSEFDFEAAEETGDTFVHNALLKARQASRATGLPAIADDSGLCVVALDGAPGVYTARYAGVGATDRQNNDKLLHALQGVDDRRAWFQCVTVVTWPDEAREPLVAEGLAPRATLEQYIARQAELEAGVVAQALDFRVEKYTFAHNFGGAAATAAAATAGTKNHGRQGRNQGA